MNQKRVLMVTDSLNYGGIERYILEVCRTVGSDISIAVLVLDKKRSQLEENVRATGAVVFFCDGYDKISQMRQMQKIIKRERIDIVHFHVRHSHLIALAKIMKRWVILHSHFADWQRPKDKFKEYLLRLFLNRFCDRLVACTQASGDNAFLGLDYTTIKNGISFSDFRFNQFKRNAIREKMGLMNKKVLIQVGRFNWNKNQLFSLKILKELLSIDDQYALILIGDGEDRDKIIKKMTEYDIEENIFFTGEIENVNDYYSAADVFLQPSHSEGFPISIIEAQASGLICCVSDVVPKEASFSHGVKFLSLNESPGNWANEIIKALKADIDRKSSCFKDNAYDMKNAVLDLEKIYRSAE